MNRLSRSCFALLVPLVTGLAGTADEPKPEWAMSPPLFRLVKTNSDDPVTLRTTKLRV